MHVPTRVFIRHVMAMIQYSLLVFMLNNIHYREETDLFFF